MYGLGDAGAVKEVKVHELPNYIVNVNPLSLVAAESLRVEVTVKVSSSP